MDEGKGSDGRHGLLDRWVSFSLRRPLIVIAVATVMFFSAAWTASHLGLKSSFVELLPTDSPSVVNLEHLKQRISSYATLTVAMECPDLENTIRLADDLVARLKKWPAGRIQFIDYNLKVLQDFYADNKWLYAELPDLRDFRDRLAKRIKEETTDAVVESLEDEPPPKTDLRVQEFKEKYEKKSKEQSRYPKGYYVGTDRSWLATYMRPFCYPTKSVPREPFPGPAVAELCALLRDVWHVVLEDRTLAIFIRPPSGHSEVEDNEALVRDVEREIAALDPKSYDPRMFVGLTGDVKTGLEERDALKSDIGFISAFALFFILLSIVVFYRSFRSVVLCGLPVLLGTAMSLAVAYLTIGHLNTATAFLSSIITGNGINFMIMLLARFFEEIRAAGPGGLEPALRTAVRGTMRGTAVASLATSIAYGSLVFAGFRGFREFGIIGGIGMVLCWIVTFATGPALIAVVHRIKPLGARNEGSHVVAGAVGRFVVGHPRAILATALVMSCAAIVVTIPFAFDPFEYDFRNLRNKEGTTRGSAKISYRIDRIFDLPQSPTPVVADNLADVPRIQQAILDAPGARAVIGDAKTLFDFLPKDQEAKLDVLAEIRALIDRKIDFLSEEDQKEILDYRPPERLRVLALDDVPEMVARPFAESDGTRGRVLFVYAHKDESLLEGRYLLKFAQFIRGIHVEGAHFVAVGQPMVFADMIAAIIHDGIKVSIIAVTGILVLLVVAFRSRRAVFGVAMAVGFGTLWMIACAALFDLKLNFLNFVVLPIILGDGVDYGANLWERYREDGPGNNADIIKSTGGAVVLESITANIGYATLILSTNMALQSFGILANIGEYTTLAAAVIVMMAFLTWRERSRRARVAVPAPAGAGAGESPQA